MKIPLKKHLSLTILIASILCIAGCIGINNNSNDAIPNKSVWKVVRKEAKKHNLNPDFVYAIVFAESSFRPRANSGKARGMMQLTQPAWEMVSDDSYRNAWNWKKNIQVGTAYLALNRDWLEKTDRFSYARLAVAYRHGYGALKRNNYNTSEFPTPKNKIYRKLFLGRAPQIAKN